MSNTILQFIDALELKRWIHDDHELALLREANAVRAGEQGQSDDVRAYGVSGAGAAAAASAASSSWAGAAGAVSDSGGIDLHPETDPKLPRFATLELGESRESSSFASAPESLPELARPRSRSTARSASAICASPASSLRGCAVDAISLR